MHKDKKYFTDGIALQIVIEELLFREPREFKERRAQQQSP